jgi:chromosome condensin MukBEF ATPase and DNA-binding subunit MukB
MSGVSRKEFETLKEQVSELNSKLSNVSFSKEKKKREPTEYNKFIGSESKKIKKEHPDVEYKEIFKMATAKWRELHPKAEPEDMMSRITNSIGL